MNLGMRTPVPAPAGPPPEVTTGFLLENGADFLMQEDGTSYVLQEA